MTTPEEKAAAAAAWWRSLSPYTTDDGRHMPGNRAALARLRRCTSVMEAAAEPATAKLVKALQLDRRRDDDLARAAALAVVLAQVRQSSPSKIAHAIGAPRNGEPEDAVVKPNRFRTLMAARTGDELMTSFRRVVALLDRTANVRDLSKIILGWTDDEAGDRTRTRFAFDYHGAGEYAPEDNITSTSDREKV